MKARQRLGIRIMGIRKQRVSTTSNSDLLSLRRREVLDLVCKGLTNREIGKQLGIGSRTVKWYISQLLAIYEATNRTELVGIVLSNSRPA